MTENHDQIMLMLGEIIGTQKAMITRLDIANGRTDKNEKRIRVLENSKSYQHGKSGVIGAVGGILASISVEGLIKYFFR